MTRFSALGAAALLLVTGIAVRDVEAIAIAVLLVGGVVLLGVRGGLIGRVVLGLLFADIVFWMAPAAWSNASHGDAISTFAIPLLLVGLSLAGLGGVARLPERPVGIATVGLLVVALGVAVLPSISDNESIPSATPSSTPSASPPSEWVDAISSRGAQFSTSRLTATSGKIAVVFHNKDLFWHTFTIDNLDVNLRAPLGATRVVRFDAPAGTYEFYCAIPGHKAAGMKGTLIVT